MGGGMFLEPSSHYEKMDLANSIEEALLRKWDDVEAVGLFGSVARGDDTQWSDLDMICIVKSGKDDLFFMYGKIPVWVEVWSKDYIARKIRQDELGPEWPISVNKWFEVIPLYDPHGIFQELRGLAESLPESFYIKGAKESLLDAYLWLTKMEAAHETADEIEAREAAHHLAHDLAMYIAYLNRTFYKKGFKSMFREYEEFKVVPAHYGDAIHKLAGHVFVDLATLKASAEELWVECLKTAELNRVKPRQIESLGEI